MAEALAVLGVLAVAGALAVVVFLAREQRISTRTVRLLAIVSAAALLAMVLTDWPSEVLADFWASHTIVAGLLTTVLLVAVVFLAFEDAERRTQERLDSSVTVAGLGGIVDHLVDVEVALALLSQTTAPDRDGWAAWDDPGRPLRWLREHREQLARSGPRGGARERDPRHLEPHLPNTEDDAGEWRPVLVDQCVRRLLGALRDWSPMIRGSRNGVAALVAVAGMRNDLMRLADSLQRGMQPEEDLSRLRLRARLLALFFESESGATTPRPEVLMTAHPLRADAAVDGSVIGGTAGFDPDWRRQIERVWRDLSA